MENREMIYLLIQKLNLSVEVIKDNITTNWQWDYVNNKLKQVG